MDKIKLYIFHTGNVRVDQAIPLHERSPRAVTGLFRSQNKKMVLPASFSERRIPGFTVNNSLAAKALDWLIQCRQDPSCMGVYVNHDPTVQEQVLEVE